MAIDTFMSIVGVYENVDDALADYEAIKELHVQADLMDAYDAAVIERRADGKVKIVKKHETPTRVGGVLGAGVLREHAHDTTLALPFTRHLQPRDIRGWRLVDDLRERLAGDRKELEEAHGREKAGV